MPDVLPVALAIAVVILLAVNASLTVVKPNEAIVVFRLGKASANTVHGPGLHVVVPVIDRAVRVLMRDVSTEMTVRGTSKDDMSLNADVTIRWRVIDPVRHVLSLADPVEALTDVARRALHVIDADDAIADPGRVATAVETQLQEEGAGWGIRIGEVFVRRVSRGF